MSQLIKSVVGVRASWFCVVCLFEAEVHQLVMPGPLGLVGLERPKGWVMREGQSFCPRHTGDAAPARERAA